MTMTTQHLKIVIGLVLGFGIGFGCRVASIPSPAPPVITGALLVVAMTVGWILTDRWLSHRPKVNEIHCGGPTGLPHNPQKD
jgi:XapX domain-containing protein